METISKKFPGCEVSLIKLFRGEEYGMFPDTHVYVNIIWHKTTIEIPCSKNLSETINSSLSEGLQTEKEWINLIKNVFPIFENPHTGFWIKLPDKLEKFINEELKDVGKGYRTEDDMYNPKAQY